MPHRSNPSYLQNLRIPTLDFTWREVEFPLRGWEADVPNLGKFIISSSHSLSYGDSPSTDRITTYFNVYQYHADESKPTPPQPRFVFRAPTLAEAQQGMVNWIMLIRKEPRFKRERFARDPRENRERYESKDTTDLRDALGKEYTAQQKQRYAKR